MFASNTSQRNSIIICRRIDEHIKTDKPNNFHKNYQSRDIFSEISVCTLHTNNDFSESDRKLIKLNIIQGGPDITCQKNSGSLEGSNKSKKPPFVRSKIMGIN
jgi:hypothetical protein